MVVVIIDFTGAARGFIIMSCAPAGSKSLDSTDLSYTAVNRGLWLQPSS